MMPMWYEVVREQRRNEPVGRPPGSARMTRFAGPAQLLDLQRAAGNRAVGATLAARTGAPPAVQRCGDRPCDCSDDDRVAAALPQPGGVQREAVGDLATTGQDPAPVAGQADGAGTPVTSVALVTGSMSPGAALATSGGQRLCFPPAAFTDPQFGSGFGTIAERLIENDYCDTLGCNPASTYVDNNNPTQYRSFLTAHNPSLATGGTAKKLALAAAAGIARPDIMCDDGTRKDYYEIKPLSPSGVDAGMTKLVEIMGFMALLKLPYVPGVTYSPSKDIPIMSGLVLGEPLTVSLNVNRFLPGLVTYSLCLEGNLAQVLAKVAIATLLAWLAAQLIMAAAAGVLVLA